MKYKGTLIFGILFILLSYLSFSFFVRDSLTLVCDKTENQCVIQQDAERVIVPLNEIDAVTLDSHVCARFGKQSFIRIQLNSGEAYAFPGGKLPILPGTKEVICGRLFPNIVKQLNQMNEFLISETPNRFKISEEPNFMDYYWGIFIGVLALLSLGISIKKI